jgi:hypothetical protein
MTGRVGPRRNRFSALIAGVLAVALFAGAATANPAAFDRAMIRAASILFGPQENGERGRGGGEGGRRASPTHDADECSAIVEAFQQASPPSGDVHGLAHAIEVVEANCEKNPQANGLLTALQRLIVNAEKHAEHESNAGGRGHGNGPGNGNGQGNGNGPGNGNGNGPGNGHGPGNGQGHGSGGGPSHGDH